MACESKLNLFALCERFAKRNINREHIHFTLIACESNLSNPIGLTPRVGLEPTTTRLTAECSTIELSRKVNRGDPRSGENLLTLSTRILRSKIFHRVRIQSLKDLCGNVSAYPVQTCIFYYIPVFLSSVIIKITTISTIIGIDKRHPVFYNINCFI